MIVEDVVAEHFGIPRDNVYLIQDLLNEMDEIISDWADANKDLIVRNPDAIGENVVCYLVNDIDRFIDAHSKEDDEDWGEDYGTLVRRACRKDCFMSREDTDDLFQKYPEWQLDVYILGRNRWSVTPWNEIGMKTVQQVMSTIKRIPPMQDIFVHYDPSADVIITPDEYEEMGL